MNYNTSRKHSAGFTLVELSIVLVLIGLIIGGVLKGQELIASTRLKMTVSQWDAVKAAINTFQDKYVALPGDYASASTFINKDAPNGDGNGIIGSTSVVTSFDASVGMNSASVNESEAAWKHLSDAGLISSVDKIGSSYVLPGRVAGSSFFIYYGNYGDKTGHWLRLQAGGAAGNPAMPALSPKEAGEIDRKFDNGSFNSGSIQSGSAGSGKCSIDNATSASKTCITLFELL